MSTPLSSSDEIYDNELLNNPKTVTINSPCSAVRPSSFWIAKTIEEESLSSNESSSTSISSNHVVEKELDEAQRRVRSHSSHISLTFFVVVAFTLAAIVLVDRRSRYNRYPVIEDSKSTFSGKTLTNNRLLMDRITDGWLAMDVMTTTESAQSSFILQNEDKSNNANGTTGLNVDNSLNYSEIEFEGEEQHKYLFPMSWRDYLGLFFAILTLLVASVGGIGGGGLLIPIYVLVMGMTPKEAIPLSNVTIVGGALASNLLNLGKRHPLADRPLIDWDIINIMLPMRLVGALLGAMINKILSDVIITSLLVLVLSATGYITLKCAIATYRRETLENTTSAIPSNSEYTPLNKHSNGTSTDAEQTTYKSTSTGISNVEDQNNNGKDTKSEEFQKILEYERHTPLGNVFILVGTFVLIFVVNVLKGGGGSFGSPLGLTCGSFYYWLVNIFLLGWITLVAIYLGWVVVRKHKVKEICGYEYVKGDIVWNTNNTVLYASICGIAGLFAGMFGIGGGIISGPLMVAIHVLPEVNAASSACMLLMTSLTATSSFLAFGLLIRDYSVACFILGFFFTAFGQWGGNYWMQRFNRKSIVEFSIGLIVVISALLLTVQCILSIQASSSMDNVKRRGICS